MNREHLEQRTNEKNEWIYGVVEMAAVKADIVSSKRPLSDFIKGS